MSSNERIGSALNSSNLKMDELHSDADVVAALAFANKLGIALQHIGSAGQHADINTAVAMLARVLQKACARKKMGISNANAVLAARQALVEWLIRICRTCSGTGEQLLSYAEPGRNRRGQCRHCNGTGLFVPQWKWRRQHMELDEGASGDWWDKRINLAKEIAEDAYRSARRKVAVQLLET